MASSGGCFALSACNTPCGVPFLTEASERKSVLTEASTASAFLAAKIGATRSGCCLSHTSPYTSAPIIQQSREPTATKATTLSVVMTGELSCASGAWPVSSPVCSTNMTCGACTLSIMMP